MRKDGQPHVFKRIKLKDLYDQVHSGELSRRAFNEWIMYYRYKHWGKGVDDGRNWHLNYGLQRNPEND